MVEINKLQNLYEMCISYLTMPVKRHHDQGNLQKEVFIWAYDSRGVSVHHHHGRKHCSK